MSIDESEKTASRPAGLLSSVHRALPMHATANLRRVQVGRDGAEIHLWCVFDDPPTEEDVEPMHIAHAGVLSDFHEPVRLHIEAIPDPERIPSRGNAVAFERCETWMDFS